MPKTYQDGDNFVPFGVSVQNPSRVTGHAYSLRPSLLYAEDKSPVPTHLSGVVTFSCHKCAGCTRAGNLCKTPSKTPCQHALLVSSSDPRSTVMVRFSNDHAMTEKFVVRVEAFGHPGIYVDSRPVTVSVSGSTAGQKN